MKSILLIASLLTASLAQARTIDCREGGTQRSRRIALTLSYLGELPNPQPSVPFVASMNLVTSSAPFTPYMTSHFLGQVTGTYQSRGLAVTGRMELGTTGTVYNIIVHLDKDFKTGAISIKEVNGRQPADQSSLICGEQPNFWTIR